MYRNVAWIPLFPEFGLPFNGHLDPDNRWVKKAALIPWALVESEYRKQLSGSTTGCQAMARYFGVDSEISGDNGR